MFYGIWIFQYANGKEYAFVVWSELVTFAIVGVLQIVSGVYLCVGVLKIRKYLVDSEVKNINFKMLYIHAGSFILYLLCSTFYFTFSTMKVLYPTELNKHLHKMALLFFAIGNFISLSLLFLICLDLAKTQEAEPFEPNEDEDDDDNDSNPLYKSEYAYLSRFDTLMTKGTEYEEDEEEDAMFQQRLWNCFMKEADRKNTYWDKSKETLSPLNARPRASSIGTSSSILSAVPDKPPARINYSLNEKDDDYDINYSS